MDPTTWAWIAMVVGAGAATPLLVGSGHVSLRPLALPALAAASSGTAYAVAGSVLIDGWWPWGAVSLASGVLVALLAELAGAAANGAASSRLQDVAGWLAVGMAGLGIFAAAAIHLLMTEVIAAGDLAVVVPALAVGAAATAATWRVVTIGGSAVRMPASELVAMVIVAPAVVTLVSGGDAGAVALALGVGAIGLVAAAVGILTVRRGDRAVMLFRRTMVVAGSVGLGGAGTALTVDLAGAAVDHPRWLALAFPLGALAVLAIGQVMDWFTSDRWRSAKRVATRARAGAAAVITTGVGDAARATGWLLGILGVALVAAERIGRLAGDGALGIVLMVAAATATLGALSAGLGFAALVHRAEGPGEAASAAQREAAEARAASASAAGAISRGGFAAAAALIGFALLVALGRAAGLEAEFPGVWTMLGAIGGVAAAWYAAGWSSHLAEPPPGPHRPGGTGPTIGAVVRRTVTTVAMGIVPVGLGWIDPGAHWMLLAGVLAAGTGVTFAMVVAAGVWENVRRLIETGAYGGAASRAHRAVVAADTVGERWREVVTPAVMALVVFAAVAALAFAPVLD